MLKLSEQYYLQSQLQFLVLLASGRLPNTGFLNSLEILYVYIYITVWIL